MIPMVFKEEPLDIHHRLPNHKRLEMDVVYEIPYDIIRVVQNKSLRQPRAVLFGTKYRLSTDT